MLTVSAILSIAGNAYHAVLTTTVLNAAVAAAIAALAPAMVLTMSEIVAVVLRAPRRRRTTTKIDTAGTRDDITAPARADVPTDRVEIESSSAGTVSGIDGIDEDLDNGLLKPAVWTSVDLYLAHPDWSLSDIARHLELHTSTVSRHIKTWTQVQQKIASQRSTATPSSVDQTLAADSGHDENADDIEGASGYGVDDDYAPIGTDREYVGATR